jgi:hypothetical protein
MLSGGNFHAEPVALVADALAVAIAEIGAISERRIAMLVDTVVSRLPPFLTPEPGLNSGFMIVHVTAAALASENKSLAHPASVDSLPTSANQEDHVSMATFAARRLQPDAATTPNTSSPSSCWPPRRASSSCGRCRARRRWKACCAGAQASPAMMPTAAWRPTSKAVHHLVAAGDIGHAGEANPELHRIAAGMKPAYIKPYPLRGPARPAFPLIDKSYAQQETFMKKLSPSHLLAAAACHAPPHAQETKVAIGISGWTGFAPLTLAKEAGIFKKNGLDVTIKKIPQKDRHLAIASGDVQCAATTVETWVVWNANGVATTQIFQLDKSYGADGMVVKPSIAKIKDLKGKTVAASAPGTSPYFALAWMLKKNGLSHQGREGRQPGAAGRRQRLDRRHRRTMRRMTYEPYLGACAPSRKPARSSPPRSTTRW